MENVEVWQYFVIGGPAFILGAIVSYMLLKDEIEALKYALFIEDAPAKPKADKKEMPSEKEISKRLLSL